MIQEMLRFKIKDLIGGDSTDWIEISVEECAKMTDEELRAWIESKMNRDTNG